MGPLMLAGGSARANDDVSGVVEDERGPEGDAGEGRRRGRGEAVDGSSEGVGPEAAVEGLGRGRLERPESVGLYGELELSPRLPAAGVGRRRRIDDFDDLGRRNELEVLVST